MRRECARLSEPDDGAPQGLALILASAIGGRLEDHLRLLFQRPGHVLQLVCDMIDDRLDYRDERAERAGEAAFAGSRRNFFRRACRHRFVVHAQ